MRTLSVLSIVFVAMIEMATFACETSSLRPNILFILADDLGAHDLGCYGADLHETPHIDRLAREGLQFLNAYAPAPVCTPTRASLLTGKSPAHLQMTIWSEGALRGPTDRKLLQASSRHDLDLKEVTIARHLQQMGYLTASVGKWHLGGPNHYPEAHGFDIGIGGTHWGAPATYFFPYRSIDRTQSEFRYVPHLEFGRAGEYLTDRLTDEAIRVIEFASQEKRPFFLYVGHHAPHTPLEAKKEDIDYFASRVRPEYHHQNATYAAMIKSLDESVGRIMATLSQRNLEQNTMIVFASDNGGYLGTDRKQSIPATTNYPLRLGKGTLYEGGIRVPLLFRWPEVVQAGGKSNQLAILTDLFATWMEAVGAPNAPASEEPNPSQSLMRELRHPQGTRDARTLHFHYPHYYHAPSSTPAGAIRKNEWKLIEFFEEDRVELYQLDNDPSEKRDIANDHPARADALRKELRTWRANVGANMPTLNPSAK